jgi:N utilization substance protein B
MAGPRSEARRYALLALYQWQVGAGDPAEIVRHFLDDPQWAEALSADLRGDPENAGTDEVTPARYDAQLFSELVRGVGEHADEIDDALRPLLDRSLKSLDPVERSILRIGTYELLHSPQLPVGVVINESVNLAREFGAAEGHRYVNGVLDKLARRVRANERAAALR